MTDSPLAKVVRLSGPRVSLFAAITMLALGHPVSGQTGLTWAGDASLGLAHVSGGEFEASTALAQRLAVSARKGLWQGIGLDAELGYDWLWAAPNPDLNCIIDPRRNGGCLPDLPNMSGPAGLVGVSVVSAKVTLRVNAGMAAYSVGATRLGAPLAGIDVALAPVSWFAVVAGGRALAVPNYLGDRLVVTTLQLAVRFLSHEQR